MLSHPKYFMSVLAILLLLSPRGVNAQTETNVTELLRIAQESQARVNAGKNQTYFGILNSQDPDVQALLNDPTAELMYVHTNGRPIWYTTDNRDVGIFLRNDEVYPGGVGGYNLSGAMTTGQKLALWDGDVPLPTHVEFQGRVTLRDAEPIGPHGTRVLGSMIAAGVTPQARGMSYAAEAHAWNWTDDTAEMAMAAIDGTLISNHSYSERAGWAGYTPPFYWHGDVNVSSVEDYSFGYYDEQSREWDDLAYHAPYMLIVTSAGHDFMSGSLLFSRDAEHKHFDGGIFVTATDEHPYDGEPTEGYDTIPSYSGAKNILTVGGCSDFAGHYSGPSDIHPGGSAGPMDDGRIKPDLIAPGVSVFTSTSDSNTAYIHNVTGTSISSPAVAGSANLVREHYEVKYGKNPRSATLKALLIHTAEEAGPGDGPDYRSGWGLMNTRRAIDVVDAVNPYDGVGVGETILQNGNTDYFYFESELVTDFKFTIVWTDPPGEVSAPAVDDPATKLVNDLDLRVEYLSGTPVTHMPWVLDPIDYAGAATRGDNVVDNVEQVFIDDAAPGLYRVSISHKGALVDAPQAYSLVWSGMTPTVRAVDTRGARFEMFPGLLPTPALPVQVTTNGGEERGVFITVVEDLLLRDAGMRSWVPCPSDFFVSIYKASRNSVDPVSGGVNLSSMGQPIAQGMVTSYHPGWDFHYVPLNVELQACEDYYVSFQLPHTMLSWPWYNEGLLNGPIDVGGAIRLRNGAFAQNPANGAMPLVSFIAEVTPGAGDRLVDLQPPNTQWSTCADASYERGIFVEPTRTMRVQAVALEASVVGNARFTAKIYDATGGTRGQLIAEGGRTIDASPLQMQEVPINATLFEGRQYDVVMEFPPNTWSCHSDASLPITLDKAITVLDGEHRGDASNALMPHMTLTWREGTGGAPFDLGKQTDVFPPPLVDTSSLDNHGVYVKLNADEELYSLGWFADVPSGKSITMRVYESSNQVRGALVSEGTITSAGEGARWHDVPVSASLAAEQEYDFALEVEDVNSFGYWDDSSGLPYEAYGVFTVINGESWGDPQGSKLIWIRANACDEAATPVLSLPAPTFTLQTPYPNPATSTAIIEYSLEEAGLVSVTVYDVRGRRVATPISQSSRPGGAGSVVFETRGLPQGVYFVKLDAGHKSVTRKLLIVR